MPMVTYTLATAISARFFNFNQFVNNLDFDLLLVNQGSPLCKCNYGIVENNFLRKIFIEALICRQAGPINSKRTKRYLLDGLDNYISRWCSKNGIHKSIVSERINNVTIKTYESISNLANTLYTNRHTDFLSSPDIKNALYNIHKDFFSCFNRQLNWQYQSFL